VDSFIIEDVKSFTSKLFIKEDFDFFLLKEAEITTFNNYKIDGTIQKDYYTKEEFETLKSPEYSTWNQMKNYCFSFIKGGKTPLSFKIVLRYPDELAKELHDVNDVGLYLNVRFENKQIKCITGVSYNTFTMDKTIENLWDEKMKKFLLSLY
jgi:hypothetical protein